MLQLNCPLSVNLEIDFIILPSLWIQWFIQLLDHDSGSIVI